MLDGAKHPGELAAQTLHRLLEECMRCALAALRPRTPSLPKKPKYALLTAANIRPAVHASFAVSCPPFLGDRRWHNHLCPSVCKQEWTEEEDRIIVEAVQMYGTKWSKIVKLLPGRTDNAIKNRWNSTMRKNIRRQLKEAEAGGEAPQAPAPAPQPPGSAVVNSDALAVGTCTAISTAPFMAAAPVAAAPMAAAPMAAAPVAAAPVAATPLASAPVAATPMVMASPMAAASAMAAPSCTTTTHSDATAAATAAMAAAKAAAEAATEAAAANASKASAKAAPTLTVPEVSIPSEQTTAKSAAASATELAAAAAAVTAAAAAAAALSHHRISSPRAGNLPGAVHRPRALSTSSRTSSPRSVSTNSPSPRMPAANSPKPRSSGVRKRNQPPVRPVHRVVQAVHAVPGVPIEAGPPLVQAVHAVPAVPAPGPVPSPVALAALGTLGGPFNTGASGPLSGSPLAHNVLSAAPTVQQSPLAQYHSSVQVKPGLPEPPSVAPGLAQQQQIERQRMLEEQEAGGLDMDEEIPAVMQIHSEGSAPNAAPAQAGAWGDSMDTMASSAGEERWADDMFDGMFDDGDVTFADI